MATRVSFQPNMAWWTYMPIMAHLCTIFGTFVYSVTYGNPCLFNQIWHRTVFNVNHFLVDVMWVSLLCITSSLSAENGVPLAQSILWAPLFVLPWASPTILSTTLWTGSPNTNRKLHISACILIVVINKTNVLFLYRWYFHCKREQSCHVESILRCNPDGYSCPWA